MIKLPVAPRGWGADTLSSFIDNTRLNEFATFANRRRDVGRLCEIDRVFRELVDGLLNNRELLSSFLLLRTHSCFLAACRLALSGQAGETFIVLRTAIEAALYAAFVASNPERQELWLRRDDDKATKAKFRKVFTSAAVLRHIETRSRRVGRMAGTLYERTLDYGAHPNRDSILTLLEQKKSDRGTEFKLIYLVGDGVPLHFALRSTAQVGICSLRVLRTIYTERFDILGLTDRMERVSAGL